MGGKGALPSPVEHLSVLVCVGSWHVSDVAGRKKVVVSLHQRKLLLQGRPEEHGGLLFLSKSAISVYWDMEIAAGKGSGTS